MKKKLLILVVLIIGMYFGYRYLYHEHRDIAKEEAAFALKVPALLKEFEVDETKANTKYLDKPVLISGKVTSVDVPSKTIVIDKKLLAILVKDTKVEVNTEISIQGRLIGYDNLLGEIKLDQSTIK
ncbi:OB-fold protein [Flavobacterium urocaniciphilum]|uniref:tRNA_anti-like n=1 Tax=Flavobacterium urocaniciphilum TaxID=1299341 RepID=A0A1H8YV95_9FLAO|nr:hypothetical protein [Flavobacterium urocaniciphilum]SEP56046.1 tRNA_anti-like [Flavobacterium urocaniciphilum]